MSNGQLLLNQETQTFTASAGPFTTKTQAYSYTIPAGSLLLCFVCWGPDGSTGNTITGVTDNSSGGTNIWLPLPQLSNGTYEYCQMWYCLSSKVAASAPTVTVAWSGTGSSYPQISVVSYYNTAGFTAVLDQYAGAVGSGASLASGYTGTLAQPNELAIGYGADYAQLNFTPGTTPYPGWTALTSTTAVVGSLEFQYPSTTAAIQSTWTTSSSNPWLSGIVTFSTAPKPSSISATSDAQGFTGNITVTGTDFDSGGTPTILSFSGTGITVNSYSVQSATTITANITIALNAALSARDVTVTNQGNLQTGTLAAAFTVTAAVNLLSNSTVAVSAGSTIVNTGNTVLDGDLDLSPGSVVSGFPPGTITGTQHVDDATAVQSQLDVTTAYNQAAAVTGATTIATALDAATLYTGVYTSAAGTFSLSGGTLTLDAQGDPNAVWIFQMATTLITTSGSVVQVINGGSAKNVFWAVGSSATIGATNTFVGTILAHTTITINGTGTTVAGGLLANAAVNLSDVAVTVTPPPNPPSRVYVTAPGTWPVNTAFSVTLLSTDNYDVTSPVTQDTNILLTVFQGTGALSGTVTGTILSGQSTATISGVMYNVAEAGVIFFATSTSGDSLSPFTNWATTTFTAPTVFNVSGSLGILGAGAIISYTGTSSGSVVADASGNYTISLPNGSYTITPSLPGYNFIPTGQLVTVSGANVTGINFTLHYSEPDCRDYATFPNLAIGVNGTLTYTVIAHPSHPAPVDSRVSKPVASGIYPQNSRAPGTFGPGE